MILEIEEMFTLKATYIYVFILFAGCVLASLSYTTEPYKC